MTTEGASLIRGKKWMRKKKKCMMNRTEVRSSCSMKHGSRPGPSRPDGAVQGLILRLSKETWLRVFVVPSHSTRRRRHPPSWWHHFCIELFSSFLHRASLCPSALSPPVSLCPRASAIRCCHGYQFLKSLLWCCSTGGGVDEKRLHMHKIGMWHAHRETATPSLSRGQLY